MSKVFSAHAVSVDGYISGRDPSDGDGGFGRGLGDAPMLFDRYSDGDTPSQALKGFWLERAQRTGLRRARREGGCGGGRTHHIRAFLPLRRRQPASNGPPVRPRSTVCAGDQRAPDARHHRDRGRDRRGA